MKRNRSVQEKSNSSNFKCNMCTYSAKSKWALKAHVNHKELNIMNMIKDKNWGKRKQREYKCPNNILAISLPKIKIN